MFKHLQLQYFLYLEAPHYGCTLTSLSCTIPYSVFMYIWKHHSLGAPMRNCHAKFQTFIYISNTLWVYLCVIALRNFVTVQLHIEAPHSGCTTTSLPQRIPYRVYKSMNMEIPKIWKYHILGAPLCLCLAEFKF